MVTKLGRKSAEDLGPIIPGVERRPPPPDDLEPAEQAHWAAITGALPWDWFNGGSAPLLKQLCRHIHNADELAQDIAQLRGELAAAEPKARPGVLRQTLRMQRAHGFESDRIASLSTKLKLTKMSRYARSDAAYAGAKGTATSPDPWTDWGPGSSQ
jgi:hypothetical protein